MLVLVLVLVLGSVSVFGCIDVCLGITNVFYLFELYLFWVGLCCVYLVFSFVWVFGLSLSLLVLTSLSLSLLFYFVGDDGDVDSL